jgi:hypothetical protein
MRENGPTFTPGLQAQPATDEASPRRDGPQGRPQRERARLDTRLDPYTLAAVRARAQRRGLAPSTWVRAVIVEALDARRTAEVEAAIAAGLLDAEHRAQASANVRELAAQIRPLAINVNDLDRRARRGEPVTLAGEVPALIALLDEVRRLLGDRLE